MKQKRLRQRLRLTDVPNYYLIFAMIVFAVIFTAWVLLNW